MHGGAVCATVVAEHSFDADAVAAIEADCSMEKRRCRFGFLVGQDLGVGEAAVVVDGDVHVLVADRSSLAAGQVGEGGVVVLDAAADAPARAADDPGELLDINMQELARPGALVADCWLETESAKTAKAAAGKDPRDGRQGHRERLGDLGGCHPQPAQLHDDRYPLRAGAVGDPQRRRRAVEEQPIATAIATSPLTSTTHTDAGGLSRRPHRPALINDAASKLSPTAPTESRVTVQIHPGAPSLSCL